MSSSAHSSPPGPRPAAAPGTTVRSTPASRTLLATLATLVLLLSSCSLIFGTGGDQDTAADGDLDEETGQFPAPEESPVGESSPPASGAEAEEPADGIEPADGEAQETAVEQDAPTIHDADFAALEWREAVNEYYVTPAVDDGPQTVQIGEQIAYADVNGDGHDDALVPLQITDGNWFEQIWYIWTWDPRAELPVQVESPVARTARCGDAVHEVAGADGAFTISESLRIQGDQSLDCASEGPIQITRHVTLDDGWPVLTGGLTGDGGICPQPNGTDSMFAAADVELRLAPYDDSSLVTEPAPDAFDEVEEVWSHMWLYREHWMLVHLGYYDQEITGGYTPCAWAYLAEDTRPIPHAPHQEG